MNHIDYDIIATGVGGCRCREAWCTAICPLLNHGYRRIASNHQEELRCKKKPLRVMATARYNHNPRRDLQLCQHNVFGTCTHSCVSTQCSEHAPTAVSAHSVRNMHPQLCQHTVRNMHPHCITYSCVSTQCSEHAPILHYVQLCQHTMLKTCSLLRI